MEKLDVKDKYYTPSIEEFHVGFEYEDYNKYRKEWIKSIWTREDFENDSHVYYLFELFYGKQLRVKYLDKEDIESLGFEYYKTHPGMNQMEFEGGKYLLTYDPDFAGRGWLRIAMEGEGDVTLFTGTIKNKSELKKILEMINVKK